ncbi:MAG: hypothetical protein HZB38_02000 [Planctomycetes bacterium]|nr:hypothetical protein [Planctomycetota bacterium]
MSENVAYYRLMAGGGSLAAQTEVFGGDQVDSVAGIIPLGPPYPTRAVMVGTSESFGTPFPKPYLIDRQVFAQRHCNDAMVPSLIQPVILPQHEVLITTPLFPMRSQELLLLGEEIYDQTICGLSGGVDTGGSVTVEQIFQIPNPTPSPVIDPGAIPSADAQVEDEPVVADNP